MGTFVLRFLEDESGVTRVCPSLRSYLGRVHWCGNTLLTVYNGITAALAPAP